MEAVFVVSTQLGDGVGAEGKLGAVYMHMLFGR